MDGQTGQGCRGCGRPLVDLVLDLGEQPAAESFPPLDDPAAEQRFPLRVYWCPTCRLAQLGPTVSTEDTPAVVESAAGRAHAERVLAETIERHDLLAGASVREFPSPHGSSWLPHALTAGLRPVEAPARADLLLDAYGLLHSADLSAELAARAEALADDGVLVMEFHHLQALVTQAQFDMVRHGHTMYLSLESLVPALARHGLGVTHVDQSPLYGGGLVLTVRRGGQPDPTVDAARRRERMLGLDRPDGIRALQAAADKAWNGLRTWLSAERAAGRTVVGYGAPTKATTLLCGADVGPDLLPFTVDASPAKHGRAIPGSRIPIRPVADLLDAKPDSVLILIWDLVDEIRAQLPEVPGWGGRFVVAVPELTVLEPG